MLNKSILIVLAITALLATFGLPLIHSSQPEPTSAQNTELNPSVSTSSNQRSIPINGPKQQLIVLQYHHVSTETPAITSISPQQFKQHLQLLEQQQMQVVSLPETLQSLFAGQPIPDRAVAITFDDAYLSVYRNAAPLLLQRHWPFTIFINTAAVDQGYLDNMNWTQLRELQTQGASLANHTVSHPYLIERPAGISLTDWLTQEVSTAEQRLQEEIGHSWRLLAYPYGEYNLEIADWLKTQGYLAMGQQSGPISAVSPKQWLPRFPVSGPYANPETLLTKLRTLAPDVISPATDPVLMPNDRITPPTLAFQIQPQWQDRSDWQCYAYGQAITTQTETDDKGIQYIQTQAATNPIAGRFRYNCTSPSQQFPGYFYWHSQLWINPDIRPR